MNREQVISVLRKNKLFNNINNWEITPIYQGKAAEFACNIKNSSYSYFVKDIKENEKNALYMILPLKSTHFVKTSFLDLLQDNVLVADFVDGGNYTSSRLSESLIIEYAAMQKALNDREYFKKHFRGQSSVYKMADDGYFKKTADERIKLSLRILEYFLKRGNSQMRSCYMLFKEIDKLADSIIYNYYSMPFAWLHNDFRSQNMVGELPVLVDWGESYGYGPFLQDIAPYMLDNSSDIELYFSVLFGNPKFDSIQVDKWLVSVLIYRLAGEIIWHYFNTYRNSKNLYCIYAVLENNYPAYRKIGEHLKLYYR
jgi:hypothetical protein